MTEKANERIRELKVQQKVIEKITDILETLERDKEYAKKTYDVVEIKDEDGNTKRDYQSRPYTEEELAEHPEVFIEIEAYDRVAEALEKIIG